MLSPKMASRLISGDSIVSRLPGGCDWMSHTSANAWTSPVNIGALDGQLENRILCFAPLERALPQILDRCGQYERTPDDGYRIAVDRHDCHAGKEQRHHMAKAVLPAKRLIDHMRV